MNFLPWNKEVTVRDRAHKKIDNMQQQQQPQSYNENSNSSSSSKKLNGWLAFNENIKHGIADDDSKK